jgi:subtilase family serine protease
MIANASPCISSIEVFPSYSSISEGVLLTGPKVATAYNIPASTGANVKVGIISLGGGYSQTDLNKSMANISLTAPTVYFVPVDGATNNYTGNAQLPDGENALDLVCVSSLVPQANIVLYKAKSTEYTNGSVSTPFTNYANVFQRAVDENCDIITMSWGGPESGYDFLSLPLANAVAKGITVFISSGDYGSTADGTTLTVQYPATSSNVISVGGTNLSVFSGNSIRSNETAYNNSESGLPFGFGGSGGISSFIPVPSWQTGLTYRKYFTSNSSYGPSTTINGRGIPDISAAMNAYGVWLGNTIYGFSGTSASAPIMAGMFARYVSLTGRRPIPNAIHPVLYGNLSAYYDIQTGNNASKITTGFAANIGWDPVTGVGVPYGNVVYQMVSSGGTTVKTAANTWSYVANVQVKTAANTWSNVKAIWTKVDSSTWKQTY